MILAMAIVNLFRSSNWKLKNMANVGAWSLDENFEYLNHHKGYQIHKA
jgi:hypothetical protein